MRWFILAVLAASLAAPLGAQQWQVARDQFAFAGGRLSIHVDVEAEGTLRLLRGPAGSVRVSGWSDPGMTAAGLTAAERLTLTALGSGAVEFMVAVPEGVRVDVHLPDRRVAESLATRDRGGTFHWQATGRPLESATDSWTPAPAAHAPGAVPPMPTTRHTVLAADLAPRVISLPDLDNIRSVTVRIEGDAFLVQTSRPMALRKGDPQHVEIRPGGPPMDLTVWVPAGTASFTLQTRSGTALRLMGGEMSVFCTPNTRQWLSGGRAWVTFTLAGGDLRCHPAAQQRHER